MTTRHARRARKTVAAAVLATAGASAGALVGTPAAQAAAPLTGAAAAPQAGTPSRPAPRSSSPGTAVGAAAATVDRRITDSRVTESSGLARSTYPRAMLFTHNDSGDAARVFAVDRYSRTRAVITLAGVTADDTEDIAAGPGHHLWLADIGDNSISRAAISVYRFVEPRTLSTRTVSSTRFRFRYADGRHDAEALLVHPRTGRLYVVSKAASGARVYRAPATLSSTQVNVLRSVARAPARVTAGSFGPGGVHYALGDYDTAYVYRSLGELQRTIALPATRQGESLEYSRDARQLFRGSEGANSPVFRVPVG